jgi:hypothetical protein
MPAKKKTAAEENEKETKATGTKKTATTARASKSATASQAASKAATAGSAKASTAKKAKATEAEPKTTAKKTSSAARSRATKESLSKPADQPEKIKTAASKAAAKTTKAAAAKRTTTRTRKTAEQSPVAGTDTQPVIEEAAIASSSPTDVREHFVATLHAVPPQAPQRDLPPEYGDTKIVLLVRDPEWVFAYWELNDETRAQYSIPRTGQARRLVLRVYNITGRDWPRENAQYFFDIDVGPYANNWYIRVPESDAQWVAELGVFDEQGEYVPIVASNVVHTPRDGMSPETDEQWMVIEETFRKLFESSGGTRIRDGWRGSEELWRHLQKQVLPSLAGAAQLGGSGALMGSGGVAAAKPAGAPGAFWLQAETELILYGATEPTAKVTVNDEPVQLRADGTFTLRFALPDGTRKLVVRAVSADAQHERIITKEVRKLTK